MHIYTFEFDWLFYCDVSISALLDGDEILQALVSDLEHYDVSVKLQFDGFGRIGVKTIQ